MSQIDIALRHLLSYEVAHSDYVFRKLNQHDEFELFLPQDPENLGIFDLINLVVF